VRTVFSGELRLSYSQLYVEDALEPATEFDLGSWFAGQVNGLCGAGIEGGLWLITGTHTGVVAVTVEMHDDAPAPPMGWDEVVETAFTPLGLPVRLIGCMAEEGVALPLAPGVSHRVRFCALGMDAGHAEHVRSAASPDVERYVLQFWPGRAGPDAVLRRTGQVAAYQHESARDLPAQRPVFRGRDPDRQRKQALEENLRWAGRFPPEEVRAITESSRLEAPGRRRDRWAGSEGCGSS
jgi:hypothetical protein